MAGFRRKAAGRGGIRVPEWLISPARRAPERGFRAHSHWLRSRAGGAGAADLPGDGLGGPAERPEEAAIGRALLKARGGHGEAQGPQIGRAHV